MEGTTMAERYKGSLTGLAAGDMLGARDVTSRALCLADSLARCNGYNATDQMETYVRWYRNGYLSSTGRCFDIGNTTKYSLEKFESLDPSQKLQDPYVGPNSENTAGNGSIMGLAPIPLAFRERPKLAIHLAGWSSALTHGARECIDGARYLSALILGALYGVPKEELLVFRDLVQILELDTLLSEPLTPKIADVATGSFKKYNPPQIQGSGYVVKSLEAALWAFHNSSSFEEGALKAINLGDDADTTGAVYGQLAGAYYGDHGIPVEWGKVLWNKKLIESYAEKLLTLSLVFKPKN